MKKLFLFNIFFYTTLFISAQSADERIGTMLNTNDFFGLETEFPKLKNEMQVPMLVALTNAVMDASFNRQAEAVESIDRLIDNHANEIGADNVNNMRSWQHMILFRMGEYEELTKRIARYVDDMKLQMGASSANNLHFYEKFFSSMKGQKKSELIRGDRDCEIPIFIQKIESENIRKGHLIYVPVTVHDTEEKFIFDTGCPGGAFMSEKYARKFNVKITMDSLNVTGVGGSGWGKMGILDSIKIGNMVFKNLVVTIVPDSPDVDSILPISINLVLGSDIMRQAGEVQILPKEEKIIFPIQKTQLPATGHNMYVNGRDLFFVKCYSDNEQLIMLLDTGDTTGGLSTNYYQRHKDEIDKIGIKQSATGGGFGGLINIEYYKVPSIPIKIGNVDCDMKNTSIAIDNKSSFAQGGEDGTFGMDLIKMFDKVTLNFSEMFIAVE